MIERDLSSDVRESLNSEASPDALLTFVEITHPALTGPIRVVDDVAAQDTQAGPDGLYPAYIWRGVGWYGVMFGFEAANDDDRQPEARLVLPAINRTIAEALLALPDRAKVSVWVLTSADFDIASAPRVAVGEPVPLLQYLNFDLTDVQGTATEASGRIMLRDYTQEPWPGIRATQSRCPGLFT